MKMNRVYPFLLLLAGMACQAGLEAEARNATLEEIVEYLRRDWMVVASVSYEVGDDRLPITKQGGHLMVITGADCMGGKPAAFYVNNPSGRRAELQAGARLTVERFIPGYTGRVILIHRPDPEAG